MKTLNVVPKLNIAVFQYYCLRSNRNDRLFIPLFSFSEDSNASPAVDSHTISITVKNAAQLESK